MNRGLRRVNLAGIAEHRRRVYHARMTASSDRSRILRLAVPAVLNNISITVMQTVDMVFVGGLGPEAIGAVGTMITLIWAVMTLADGFSVGLTATVSHRIGAGDMEDASLFGRTGLWALTGFSFFLLPVLLQARGLLFDAISLPAELSAHADAYFSVFTFFLPVVFFRTSLDATHRASGAAMVPTAITIGINVLNIALDPLLIFGWGPFPALGTAGAAWATGISYSMGTLVQALWVRRARWSPFRGGSPVSRSRLRRILDIGIPAILEQGAMAVSQNLIIAWAVNPQGALAAASFQIVMRLASLSFTPAFGFGMASIVLVGQSLGAGDTDAAERLGWKSTGYSMVVLLGLSLVYWFLPGPLVGIFTKDPEVIRLSLDPMRVYALTMVWLGATMVLAPALRGAGDTKYTMTTMFAARFLVRLPLAWFLGIPMGWGLAGVWIGMGSDFMARGILLAIRFKNGKWKTLAKTLE